VAVQWVRFAEQSGTGTSGTLSIAFSSGGVDAIAVFVITFNNLGDSAVDSVTWDAAGTPQAFTNQASGGGVSLWVLTAPAIGVKLISVNFSGSGDILVSFGATGLTGVHATVPVGTAASQVALTNAPTATAPTVNRNDYVIGAIGVQSTGVPSVTIGAGQEKRWEQTNGPNVDALFVKLTGSHQPGIESGTRTCNASLSSVRLCSTLVVPFLPAAFFRPGSPDHILAPSHVGSPDHVLAPTLIADPN
jgi:hypothetical protein